METQGNVALQNTVDEQSAPLSFGQYLGMMIVSLIPCVGFIMMLVWSFGSKASASKKNWARAHLVFMIIAGIIIGILAYTVGVALMNELMNAAIDQAFAGME
jgi:hypothetical protein